jgi:hypothetical protein
LKQLSEENKVLFGESTVKEIRRIREDECSLVECKGMTFPKKKIEKINR